MASKKPSGGSGGSGGAGTGSGRAGTSGGAGTGSSLMSRIVASADPNADAAQVNLSQEAHDRLSAELEDLTTRGRVEIAHIIETARELGDLKENGDYHAAKEEQGKMEGRIRHLENLLEKAVVTSDGADGPDGGGADGGGAGGDGAGDGVSGGKSNAKAKTASSQTAQVGSIVTLKYEGEDDQEVFLLASVEEQIGDHDLLSPQSPLGAALLGSAAGQTVSYEVAQANSDKTSTFIVEVLEVK